MTPSSQIKMKVNQTNPKPELLYLSVLFLLVLAQPYVVSLVFITGTYFWMPSLYICIDDTFYSRRRLAVMKFDLANRTGHQNYTVDTSSEALPLPMSQPESLTTGANHLYVVNYSKPDKTANITLDRLNKDDEFVPKNQEHNS